MARFCPLVFGLLVFFVFAAVAGAQDSCDNIYGYRPTPYDGRGASAGFIAPYYGYGARAGFPSYGNFGGYGSYGYGGGYYGRSRFLPMPPRPPSGGVVIHYHGLISRWCPYHGYYHRGFCVMR
jgi:hypothetical protein